MDTSHLTEYPVPDVFPEGMKKVLRKKNEAIRKKLKLINTNVEYDEQTMRIFHEFISDFQNLYLGVLTDEEIMARLKANIKHNIKFVDIKMLDEDNKLVGGFYDSEKKAVYINNLYYNSLKEKDKDLFNAVIFHELCHALVCDNPYDNIKCHELYENGNFMTESIVTIMEEDYVNLLLGKNVRRVNDYIPTYAKELRAVFGEDLIKTYIRDYKCIESLFPKNDVLDYYTTELIGKFDDIYAAVKLGEEGSDVFFLNKTAELGVAVVLDKYLTGTNLPEEEKLERIIELVKLQYTPDFNKFQEIIRKHIKNMDLINNNPIAKLLYNKEAESKDILRSSKNISLLHLSNKLDKFNACGLYGANEIEEVTDEYDGEMLPTYDEDKCRHFAKNMSLYESLYGALKNGTLKEEDLQIISLEKYSKRMRGTHTDLKHEIDKGTNGSARNLFLGLMVNEDIYKCKTKDKEFYIDTEVTNEVLLPMSVEDAVVEFVKIYKEEKDKDLKECYLDGVEKLKALKEKGIHTIYTDELCLKFLYEENGIIHLFDQSSIDDGETSKGCFEEGKIKLKKVAPPNINMSSKKY